MTEFSSNLTRIARRSYQRIAPILKHPSFVTSLVIAGLVIGVRQLGGLQTLELMTYDQMVRLRPDGGADSRLLIVAITEDDIRSQNQWPISDGVVAQLLVKLQSYQPRLIGLDLYRDVPQQPGQLQLAKQLLAPNIIAIKLLADTQGNEVPPPPGFPPKQVGFSDIVIDPDAVVRRNLLFAKTDANTEVYSFGLQLSLAYLGISTQSIQVLPDSLQVRSAVFPSLSADSGNYRNLDDRGYQILLNYRTGKQIARSVTLTQVLQGQLNPDWVKDKLVLVGTTAPSVKDLFVTPYNLSDEDAPKTPGVEVHAQMVSQILDVTTGTKPLIWYWAEPTELFWIWVWALVGSILGWRLRHPLAWVLLRVWLWQGSS
jgi:CHASE2 domain-containing sensor protein